LAYPPGSGPFAGTRAKGNCDTGASRTPSVTQPVTYRGRAASGLAVHQQGAGMTPRIDYTKLAPKALQAIMGVENYVRQSSLEQSLKSLVKLRVSYMNGCAYCVDMHSKDARAEGETEQRVYAVPVWADTPFFSERERAAFEWA